ncbi:mucin-12-like [Hoplias malabaricus]|uniref:mucin-12-like n=1 Tax=Hoplias malabaricus TaxID=27720 RepID=UPI003461B27B
MTPGFNSSLALLCLVFLVEFSCSAPPSKARSIAFISEDRNPNEELKRVDNPSSVDPSSQRHPEHSVPITTDTKHSERSAGEALFRNENSSREHITHRAYSAPHEHALRPVHPYPVSHDDAVSSRSTTKVSLEGIDSHYKPHRLSPSYSGERNQDQYMRHVTGWTPLPQNHTDGAEHDGRALHLSKDTIRISEKSSIIRLLRQSLNESPSEFKPVISNPVELWKLTDGSSKIMPRLEQSAFVQEPGTSYAAMPQSVQDMKGALTLTFQSNQGKQTLYERGTTRRRPTTAKPSSFIKVMTSSAFHPAVTNSDDKIQDVHGTSRHVASASCFPTSMSTTRNIYHLFPSAVRHSAPSQKTLEFHQRKPSMAKKGTTIYTTPASPLRLWHKDASQNGRDVGTKMFNVGSFNRRPFNYSAPPDFKVLGLQNIQSIQTIGTVQWVVVKPSHAPVGRSNTYHSPPTKLTALRGTSTQNANPHSSAQINVIRHGTKEAGPSEVRPFQMGPVSSSQRFLTSVSYQTSKLVPLKNIKDSRLWQTIAMPASVNSGITQTTGETFGKLFHDHSNPPEYVPALSQMKNSQNLGQRNREIFYHPQMLPDHHSSPYSKPPSTTGTVAVSGVPPTQSQSERSYGWTASRLVTVQTTEVPSVVGPGVRASESSIMSSQTSKTTDTDTGITSRKDLGGTLKNRTTYLFNGSTSMFSKLSSTNNKLGSIPDHHIVTTSKVLLNDTAPRYSKPVQTHTFASRTPPERVNTVEDPFISDGNVQSLPTTPNETLSHVITPGTDGRDVSTPASPDPVTPQHGIGHSQAKTITMTPVTPGVSNVDHGEVKSPSKAEEHQMWNAEWAGRVQQYRSRLNAAQSFRPTSSVVIGKRIKVSDEDKRKHSKTQSSSVNLPPPQPPIYRSPIIRKPKKTENNETLIQESLPPNTTYAKLVLDSKSTDITVESTGDTSRFASAEIKEEDLTSLQFLNSTGSASFSVREPGSASEESHSGSHTLSSSSLVQTTARQVPAPGNEGDGWRRSEMEPTASNYSFSSLNEDTSFLKSGAMFRE